MPPKRRQGGGEARHGGPMGRVGIGEGVYLAVQPDPLVEVVSQTRRQRALDEVPQQVAGEGAAGMGRQMEVGEKIHGMGLACLGVNG